MTCEKDVGMGLCRLTLCLGYPYTLFACFLALHPYIFLNFFEFFFIDLLYKLMCFVTMAEKNSTATRIIFIVRKYIRPSLEKPTVLSCDSDITTENVY